MKKYTFIIIVLMPALNLLAQEPADALRYSWITQTGTARNQSIGGAGVSLGGEFSTLFINPAGLGFYKTNEVAITPGLSFFNNKSTYRGTLVPEKKTTFGLGPTGIIFSLPSYDSSSNVRNFTIGFGVNRSAAFGNQVSYRGTNNQSSYSEKYLEELINNEVRDPNNAASQFPYGASLAFNTYLLDTVTVNGAFGYRSLATVSTGLIQENRISSSGGVTDIALGGAVNLKDKLFLGGTVTVPVVNYSRESSYRESDATNNTSNNFNYFEVNENLQTKGAGINVKLGLIYKPVEYVRLGLALQTPTWYTLTENYSYEVVTDLEGYAGAGIKRQSSKDFNNGEEGLNKYSMVSPWKAAASASYVFREVSNVRRQRAFIAADIEYVNHKGSSFSEAEGSVAGSDQYYKELNNAIDDQYKGTFNFKLGGELKFNTLMFRLGGAYYGNPYRYEKANKINVGGGLGYRDKGVFVDLAYVHSINKDINYPYRLEGNEGFSAATLKGAGNNFLVTVGFKLD